MPADMGGGRHFEVKAFTAGLKNRLCRPTWAGDRRGWAAGVAVPAGVGGRPAWAGGRHSRPYTFASSGTSPL